MNSITRRSKPARQKCRSEALIVKDILRWLRTLKGCKAVKTTPPGVEAGTPDILCCYRGTMWVIEAKREGERPTLLQERRLGAWRAAGAIAAWVTSLAELQAMMAHPKYDENGMEKV